jgi:hypothetical protein
VHAGEIAVSSTTTLTLDEHGGKVHQKLAYKIDYEPLDTLTLQVPREYANTESLDLRVDGLRVAPIAISRPSVVDPGAADGPVRVQIALSSPRIGLCDLEARYALGDWRLVPQSSIRRAIPLVVPLDGTRAGNRLVVTASPEVQVSVIEGPWRAHAGAAPLVGVGRTSLELAADEGVGQVELGISLAARQSPHPTTVHRAFVQTYLNWRDRQDRAVFRLSTDEKKLRVALPPGTVLADTVVLLDGKTVPTSAAGENLLRVDLPETTPDRQWLLDVHCHGTAGHGFHGRSMFELPRLADDAWVQRLYWQFTLPRSEHIIGAPAGVIHECRWGWNGLFWEREPLLGTADLEQWVGVSEDLELTSGEDSYLFSEFGRAGPFEVVILGRAWIVLVASGTALVLGLLLIYVPASRHPAALLAAAMALGAAGLVYPEPTLLAMEAAGLGLALALLAGVLERGVTRRRRGLTTLEVHGTTLDKSTTQTQFPAAAAPGAEPTEALKTNSAVRTAPEADSGGNSSGSSQGRATSLEKT